MFNHIWYLLEGNLRMLGSVLEEKPSWSIDSLPDLTGKVALVTGGYSGIGFETAKGLLMKNATVYLGVRSTTKGDDAIRNLKEATGSQNVHLLQMDLADLPSVKRATLEFQSLDSKLHLLFNNAGIMLPPMDCFTTQGYDLQFGTNVLGPYILTKLLLPIMEATAATTSAADPVRIVELSSSTHFLTSYTGADIICYESLHGESKIRTRMGDLGLYSQSKSGSILVSQARARLLKGKNIVSLSVHPGHIESHLHRHNTGFRKFMARLFSSHKNCNPEAKCTQIDSILYPGPMGAITPLYAGCSPETSLANGKFFAPWARETTPRSDHINNIVAEDKLIAWLEEQIRVQNVLGMLTGPSII